MKHTPGPWIWKDNNLYAEWDLRVQAESEHYFAPAIVQTDSGYYGPKGADRLLIASAPELLAALETMTQRGELVNRAFYVNGTTKAMREAMTGQKEELLQARAVLEKVKGKP